MTTPRNAGTRAAKPQSRETTDRKNEIGMAQSRRSICVKDQPRPVASADGLMSQLLLISRLRVAAELPDAALRPEPARLGAGANRPRAASPSLPCAVAMPNRCPRLFFRPPRAVSGCRQGACGLLVRFLAGWPWVAGGANRSTSTWLGGRGVERIAPPLPLGGAGFLTGPRGRLGQLWA